MAETRTDPTCCPPQPDLAERQLIDLSHAGELEGLFKVLANATRLRMLHALVRRPELSVGALAAAIGMKPQAVSNQLRRLVDRGIVASRRDGNNIRYRVVDPCTVGILDQGLCLAECAGNRVEAPEETTTAATSTVATTVAHGAANRTESA